MEISLCTPVPLLGQDQSTVAQQAKMTVAKCSLISCVWAHIPVRFPYYAWTAQSAHPDFTGPKVYACLGVTCHLHFWQNGRGLLCATAVTQGETDTEWESAQKINTEKKMLLPELKLVTFQSRVWHSTNWAIPVVNMYVWYLHAFSHEPALFCFISKGWTNMAAPWEAQVEKKKLLWLHKYWLNNRTKPANRNICTSSTFSVYALGPQHWELCATDSVSAWKVRFAKMPIMS